MPAESKILIADDDLHTLDMFKEYLMSMQIDVVAVTSGKEALKAAVAEKPDLIILDIMMPGLDGIETAHKLKKMQITSDIPILILTGLDSPEDRVKAFKAGACDYVSKPLNLKELNTRVSSQIKLKKFNDHIAQYNQALEKEVTRRTDQLLSSMQDVNRFSEAAHAAGLARAEFLSNMSHELRTPLNGIVGMAHLILGTNLDEEQRDYIETIITSSTSLLNIINDALDFADIEQSKIDLVRKPFKLREWFEDIVCMMRSEASKKGLAVKSRVAPNLPDHLVGDAHRLRQVVVNLVGNAIKFTGQGHILIDISVGAMTTYGVTLSFTIVDTGIGIDPEKQQLIFEAFTQSDNSSTRNKRGLGLGLAIADRIIKLMGGQIKIDSVPGNGSAVSFTANLQPLS